MHQIQISTSHRNHIIDITEKVKEILKKSNMNKGLCIVFCPHTTAAITINENADDEVKGDILNYLSRLIPENSQFSHSEGNSDAHIKASLIGNSVSIIVENGKLLLGEWQGIMFCEFDGPRERKVFVKII